MHTNQNMCINKRLKKSIDVINNILCVCNRVCGVTSLWAIFGININKLFGHNVIKKIIQNCQKLWHSNIMRARRASMWVYTFEPNNFVLRKRISQGNPRLHSILYIYIYTEWIFVCGHCCSKRRVINQLFFFIRMCMCWGNFFFVYFFFLLFLCVRQNLINVYRR